MLKHLMSGASLLAIALRDANNDQGSEKDKLREQISKGNLPPGETVVVEPEIEEEEIEEEVIVADLPPEETPEKKVEREAAEKIAAKAKRKDDRMQRRIDEAVAEREKYKKELEAFKTANPDVKLTEAEIDAKADIIASKKLADKQIKDTQEKFDAACDKLQKDARKVEGNLGKNFDDNVNDMAEQFGPIPSFMIGVLEDFDNGAEVLAYIAGTDEVAEKVYNLKTSPAKMTKELVAISNKLIELKKKPKKEISKVPDPVEPVNGSRHTSTVITEADTKPENIDSYVAKRRAQQEATRKARGW